MSKSEKMWVITAKADDPETGRYICWNELFDRRIDAVRFMVEKGWENLRHPSGFRVVRATVTYQ
jgi:hypothetical protein